MNNLLKNSTKLTRASGLVNNKAKLFALALMGCLQATYPTSS